MARALFAAVLLLATLACSSTESQLVGRWETVGTPKRTMELRQDRTYSWRLSGKTLGFLSDLVGAQQGTWSVEGQELVLTTKDPDGGEDTQRLLIEITDGNAVTLGRDQWTRLAP